MNFVPIQPTEWSPVITPRVDLSIADMQNRRRALCAMLAEAITTFEKETGVQVTDVSLTKMDISTIQETHRVNVVSVEVKL